MQNRRGTGAESTPVDGVILVPADADRTPVDDAHAEPASARTHRTQCVDELLRGWTIGRGGKVRTKPGARGRGAKYPSRLYLRSDIERLIRRRTVSQYREWTAAEDAMLGADYDTVIAARLDLAVKLVNVRRRELGIGIYRPPRSERRYG